MPLRRTLLIYTGTSLFAKKIIWQIEMKKDLQLHTMNTLNSMKLFFNDLLKIL